MLPEDVTNCTQTEAWELTDPTHISEVLAVVSEETHTHQLRELYLEFSFTSITSEMIPQIVLPQFTIAFILAFKVIGISLPY